MPTVEIPDFWMLFTPEGKATASSLAFTYDGEIRVASECAAWEDMFPVARERNRKQREGWRVIGVAQPDWMDFWTGVRSPEL
jgi:hypothetical protein